MSFIVKNTTFPSLLDLLAPHSCRGCGELGSPLCEKCKNYIIIHRQNYCLHCKQLKTSNSCRNCPNFSPTFVVDIRDSLIGRLIHDLKYNSVRALAFSLAEILNATLPNFKGNVIIVPLPTIPRHVRERGLDHTYLIAKYLAKLRGENYRVEKLLARSNNTVQVGASQKSRLTQAAKAYSLNEKIGIDNNATYLLLDDVWTTGASMKAAEQKISSAGAKEIIISVLALNSLH